MKTFFGMDIRRKVGLVLLFVVLPPLIISFITILPGALEVRQSGMCPGAPPDIPPYACSVGEYLMRMWLGPFAIMGQAVICFLWIAFCGFVALAWLIGRRWQQRLQA